MPSARVVQVVEVATRRPTRGLTLCDKAEVRPPPRDVDDATTRHLPGCRLRAHHGRGGSSVVGRVRVGVVALYARGVGHGSCRHDRDVHDDIEAHARARDQRAEAAGHGAGRVDAPSGRDKAHLGRQHVSHRAAAGGGGAIVGDDEVVGDVRARRGLSRRALRDCQVGDSEDGHGGGGGAEIGRAWCREMVRCDDGVGAHGGSGVADRARLHLGGAGERAGGEGGGGGIREEVGGGGGEGGGGDRVGDGGGVGGVGAGGEGGRVAVHGGDGRVLGDGHGGGGGAGGAFVGGVALVRRDDGVGAHGGGGVADRASLHLAGAGERAAGEGGGESGRASGRGGGGV